jgi:hypothetical protein
VSNELEGEREYESESVPDLGPLRRRRRRTIAICTVMALIGAGAAFAWYEYGGVPETLASFKATPVVSLKTFEQYQQAIAASLRRDQELLQAQDAELKRLSDQFSQLATKLDLLESKARDAQATFVNDPKAAPKKPATKPAPRISTGGNPLPPEPGRGEVPSPTTPPR